MASIRGHEVVHSDDGKYHIRLGNAITEPKTKIRGSSVAVFHGTMLKLKVEATNSATDGRYRMVYRPSVSPPSGSDSSSVLNEQLPAHGVPDHTIEQQDVVAPVYEEGEEIIVKIFTVGHSSWSRANVEIASLKCLTQHQCQHAPTYLGDFDNRRAGPRGEVVRYVLMSKLPGYALADSEDWKDEGTEGKVRSAFATAIDAVHSCCVDNDSHMGRNVLWSEEEEKGYIVDFERAIFYTSSSKIPAVYSDFDWWNIDN
ncbi:uncharacterized protein RCC_03553 [Ramularia collo-cygni]|uniref:Protein kinase domain-containing protein n=1 Tax=Ramularia collo-cygni TaxID=112498 RepID=A0A2D3V2F8_9PEZI|nr:uncharacterized protein RCC_03553 [Ramularia collo-cygni]CZT17716.1 uncharacterized protein RCC_03553 [Ramularia collo-cygni]